LQKLTIILPFLGSQQIEKKSVIAKYNIGQRIYYIECMKGDAHIMSGYVLFIGVEHPLQGDDLKYMIDKQVRNSNGHEYITTLDSFYENELFYDGSDAAKYLLKKIKDQISRLKLIKQSSGDY